MISYSSVDNFMQQPILNQSTYNKHDELGYQMASSRLRKKAFGYSKLYEVACDRQQKTDLPLS